MIPLTVSESLFDVLEEQGLDMKSLRLIRATVTNTISKVNFMGEISEPFLIKTGVRQGDGLSPLLFNLVLENVMSVGATVRIAKYVEANKTW